MPTKHIQRQRGEDEKKHSSSAATRNKKRNAANERRLRSGESENTSSDYKYNDTPKAFARMMARQSSNKRPRSGLDDGDESRAAKKQRRKGETDNRDAKIPTQEKPAPASIKEAPEIPTILPGERMADFSARVNHALPIANLARKGKVKVDGLQERQTKTEKRLQKMYAEWRAEEARRKDKMEEQQEQDEEEREEQEAALGGQSLALPSNDAAGGKKRKQKIIGEEGDDDDPWAELNARRGQRAALHDVVQAPPSFKAVPKEKFKVRNGAKVQVVNIPSSAGSLKRREELSEARREVIERYRGMMGRI